ncbi:MAG: hypothetical protein ACRCYV_05815 [Aeromonas sp.]
MRVAPLGDPLHVQSQGIALCIQKSLAALIEVRT